MASAAEQTSKQLVDLIKKMVEALERHLKDLAQQKAASESYAYASIIDKYVQDGGQIKGYFLSDDKLYNKHLAQELRKKDMPFIEYNVNGRTVLAIRDCDAEEFAKVQEQTKINEQRYFQMVGKEEMAATFEGSQRIPEKDKKFLTIDGMDKTMAQMLANKCNDITKGFMVGINKNEKSTDLMVHAKRTIVLGKPQGKNVYSQDFCRAYLAAAFSGYGPNREKNMEQLKIDENLNKKIKEFDGPGEMWITGQDDVDTVIKVTEQGFERMLVEPGFDEDGKSVTTYKIVEKHDFDEENYIKNLDVALAGIFDEVILTSKDETDKHISGVEKQHSERPQKTKDERKRSFNETVVCDKADYLIKEALEKTPFFKERDPVAQFDEYRRMAHQLFEGILVNNRPVWIETQKFEEFKTVLKERDFDVKEYMEGIDHSMDGQAIESKSAKQVLTEEEHRKEKQMEEFKKKEKSRERQQKKEQKKDERSL